MSETIKIKNNFSELKKDFQKDTGLDADDNLDKYLIYYNGRVNDYSYQVLYGLTEKLINQLEHLPDTVSLRIGEMLKDHPNFK